MDTITFEDQQTVSDLTQMLQRLERVGGTEVRIHAEGTRCSVLGSTQAPGGLGDTAPLVLVHRGITLAVPVASSIDIVVETRAVLDRLARIHTDPFVLSMPQVNLTAVWAGMLPPHQEWEAQGTLDAASLTTIAEEGAQRVAGILPEFPGQPLVDSARRQVWSLLIAPRVPAAAAFALDALGFLRDGQPVRLFFGQVWVRLATAHGEVFVRSALGSS